MSTVPATLLSGNVVGQAVLATVFRPAAARFCTLRFDRALSRRARVSAGGLFCTSLGWRFR
eukprot:14552710-Alexandrium_andersonii.AAC.1